MMYSDLSPGFIESDILRYSSQFVSPAISNFIVCHVTASNIVLQDHFICKNYLRPILYFFYKAGAGASRDPVKPVKPIISHILPFAMTVWMWEVRSGNIRRALKPEIAALHCVPLAMTKV